MYNGKRQAAKRPLAKAIGKSSLTVIDTSSSPRPEANLPAWHSRFGDPGARHYRPTPCMCVRQVRAWCRLGRQGCTNGSMVPETTQG
jgi:hypothetical protein